MTTNKDLKPWQIVSSKIIHATPWIEIVEDLCDVSGTKLEYTYTRRIDEGPLIIAEENDGSLWLVKQYRHPIKKIIWQFPVEGKPQEESWDDAAKRGLQEELNLQASEWVNLGEFYPDPGGLDQKYQVYLATNLSRASISGVQHLEGEIEELKAQKFSRAQIDELISNGEICDNWTLSALFLYDRFKKSDII